jgi:hypothetical protein
MSEDQVETKPKAKPQKRPETKIRDAVAIATSPECSLTYMKDIIWGIMGSEAPEDCAAAAADDKTIRAAQMRDEAKAIRDFGREISGLTPVQIAMVRAGIEASRKNPQ